MFYENWGEKTHTPNKIPNSSRCTPGVISICVHGNKKGRIERIISQLLDLCSKRSFANVSSIVYGHHYHRALNRDRIIYKVIYIHYTT